MRLLSSIIFASLIVVAAISPASAQTPPTFTKVFTPDTIGPGSASTLVFTITNNDADNPVTALAFTDILLTAVTIADPASASTDCTGGT